MSCVLWLLSSRCFYVCTRACVGITPLNFECTVRHVTLSASTDAMTMRVCDCCVNNCDCSDYCSKWTLPNCPLNNSWNIHICTRPTCHSWPTSLIISDLVHDLLESHTVQRVAVRIVRLVLLHVAAVCWVVCCCLCNLWCVCFVMILADAFCGVSNKKRVIEHERKGMHAKVWQMCK